MEAAEIRDKFENCEKELGEIQKSVEKMKGMAAGSKK